LDYQKIKEVNKEKIVLLNPYWVTGFCDAEACFSIIIPIYSEDKWKVRASFEINIHIKDINILYDIKHFFNTPPPGGPWFIK